MKEKENQTLRKENPRTADLGNRRFKDSPVKKTLKKGAQKSLMGEFPYCVKDASEDSIEFSSISDSKLYNETAGSIVLASTETLTPSELTPARMKSTSSRDEQHKISNTGSTQVEIVMYLLNQALACRDMEDESKRVVDALIISLIDDLYTIPHERATLHRLATKNAYIRFLCFLLVIVAVLLFSFPLFYRSRHSCSFSGLPPT